MFKVTIIFSSRKWKKIKMKQMTILAGLTTQYLKSNFMESVQKSLFQKQNSDNYDKNIEYCRNNKPYYSGICHSRAHTANIYGC